MCVKNLSGFLANSRCRAVVCRASCVAGCVWPGLCERCVSHPAVQCHGMHRTGPSPEAHQQNAVKMGDFIHFQKAERRLENEPALQNTVQTHVKLHTASCACQTRCNSRFFRCSRIMNKAMEGRPISRQLQSAAQLVRLDLSARIRKRPCATRCPATRKQIKKVICKGLDPCSACVNHQMPALLSPRCACSRIPASAAGPSTSPCRS